MRSGLLVHHTLLVLATLGVSAPVSAQTVWDPSLAFRSGLDAENPNRDQFGNPDVWSFRYEPIVIGPRDGSYDRLQEHTLDPGLLQDFLGMPGVADGWQRIGIVQPTIFQAQVSANGEHDFVIQAGEIYMHPHPYTWGILSWESPFDFVGGTVTVSGSFDRVHFGEATWFIDQGTTQLATGSSKWSPSFNLNPSVGVGDELHFIIDPAGDYSGDTTLLQLTITGVPVPPCTDVDGDGYGSPGDAACPNGAAEDCNDGNPDINPGAFEVPGDLVDENCDGDLGPCCPFLEWRNHGQYVRCVAQDAEALVAAGLFTQDEADALVSSSAQTEVGKTNKGWEPDVDQCGN